MSVKPLRGDFDTVYRPDFAGLGTECGEEGDYLLFIGDRYVESEQSGVVFQHGRKLADGFQREVAVFVSGQVFPLEFFREVSR